MFLKNSSGESDRSHNVFRSFTLNAVIVAPFKCQPAEHLTENSCVCVCVCVRVFHHHGVTECHLNSR